MIIATDNRAMIIETNETTDQIMIFVADNHTMIIDTNDYIFVIREAFPPQKAEFYDFFRKRGEGGQLDFISLIQKYICTQKYGQISE